MSGSFGAGFFTLALMAVLAGLAGLLGLVAVGAVISRRRAGRVSPLVRSLAVVGLVGVVLAAGFGVAALIDEAPVGAGLIAVLVFVPLAAGAVRGWRARRRWLDVLAGTAMAWSVPFVLGLAVFLAVNVGVIEAFQLAGGEARALGLVWIAGAGGVLVAVIGTVLCYDRVAGWLSPPGS